MKIDWRDIKLGFWLGAGLALFSLLISLIMRVTRGVTSNDG